jgi:hypothetical protein
MARIFVFLATNKERKFTVVESKVLRRRFGPQRDAGHDNGENNINAELQGLKYRTLIILVLYGCETWYHHVKEDFE